MFTPYIQKVKYILGRYEEDQNKTSLEKNIEWEVENALHWIQSRLHIVEEKMSECEIITKENVQGKIKKRIKTK
jgi:hypothetical protein